jgi:hypothetical protein
MRREADEGHPKADRFFSSNEYHAGLSNMSIIQLFWLIVNHRMMDFAPHGSHPTDCGGT